MPKPKLSDHTWDGKSDYWQDPVYLHNATAIQAELAAVFEKAKKAGIQIEYHTIEEGEIVAAVGLELAGNHPDKPEQDGVFIFASPDPDITPEIVV